MSTTVNQPSTTPTSRWRRFLASRHRLLTFQHPFLVSRRAFSVLLGAALLGGLTAWLGAHEARMPAALTGGDATLPVWRLLAMGAAVLPMLSLHSHLAILEQVATRQLRNAQRTYLAAVTAGCAIAYLVPAAIGMSSQVLLVMARSWLAWCGLALLAGAVFGWRLAWTLPVSALVVLLYWGSHGQGSYRWWEFSARSPDDLPSLLLSMGLMAVGAVAYAATPWRRAWTRLRRARR